MSSLRRWAAGGLAVVALVFAVAVARTHALAAAAGEVDDFCIVAGIGPARAPAPDPTDLAARHHACCDLGLCHDGPALPPTAPAAALPHRAPRRSGPPRRPARRPPPLRTVGFRPRAPPAA